MRHSILLSDFFRTVGFRTILAYYNLYSLCSIRDSHASLIIKCLEPENGGKSIVFAKSAWVLWSGPDLLVDNFHKTVDGSVDNAKACIRG